MNKLDFLKKKITTKQEVYEYIHELFENDMLYHFDDRASDIDWDVPITEETIDLLDERNEDMWDVLGGAKGYDLVFEIAMDLTEWDFNKSSRSSSEKH